MNENQPRGAAAPDWLPIGKHQLRIEGDIIFLKAIGDFTLDETKHFFTESFAQGDRYGYILTLINAEHGGHSTAEARKYQAEVLRTQIFPSCTAIYGASLLTRRVVGLVQRAVKLVTGKDAPNSFTVDEATARSVLATARQRFVAQGVAKSSVS